jgi:hypothetical protein
MPFVRYCGKILYSRVGHRWNYGSCALHDGYLRLHKHTQNIYYFPISRPTDATCDRFLFSNCMFITLHVSSVKRSSSGVPHRIYSLQFLCLCLSAALSCKKFLVRSFLQDSTADRHKHRNWRLYARWGTPDDERLTLETFRVINILIENKNLSQVASVCLLIEIYEDARTRKHKIYNTYCFSTASVVKRKRL